MSWRYIATRFNGDGTETVIHPELPLSGVTVSRSVSAPADISGSIHPEYRELIDEHGLSLLTKWSTGIYAEKDGDIRGGGILVDDSISPKDGSLALTVMGLSGYPAGQPYTEGNTWPPNPYPVNGIEPMSAVREIWRHLQAQRMGNLGVNIVGDNTGLRIGKQVAEGEFDTVNGELSFEYEPFLLRDFETFDLADKLNSLASGTPMEFRESHEWSEDRETILHYINYAYPRIGQRRTDFRFVMGENVDFPPIDPPSDEYASTVLALGSGEGTAMIRALVYRSEENRIRRAIAVEDKSAQTRAAINVSGQAILAAHIGVDEITEVVVLPDHVDELQGVQPGDEIRLIGDTPFRKTDMWVRIQTKTESPETGGLSFSVNRTDRLA